MVYHTPEMTPREKLQFYEKVLQNPDQYELGEIKAAGDYFRRNQDKTFNYDKMSELSYLNKLLLDNIQVKYNSIKQKSEKVYLLEKQLFDNPSVINFTP